MDKGYSGGPDRWQDPKNFYCSTKLYRTVQKQSRPTFPDCLAPGILSTGKADQEALTIITDYSLCKLKS
jgi:hypothetical protein